MKCIISGASSGFGREIAIELSKGLREQNLRLVLLGRREAALLETKRLALARNAGSLDVIVIPCDLSKLEALPGVAQAAFQRDTYCCDGFAFFNNAGDVGPLGSVRENASVTALQSAIDLNVTSALYLSAAFAKSCMSPEHSSPKRCTLVNVSSLCALEPFASMSVYCAGKAARDMYHRVLSKEMKDEENFKVLNYAPGPMHTEMHRQIRTSDAVDTGLKAAFEESFRQKQTVDPNDSAKRLLGLILEDMFESGQHIDYYDLGES